MPQSTYLYNMEFKEYLVTEYIQEVNDTFLLRLAPKDGSRILQYNAGQYCFIKNPYFNPSDARPFSIASSPTTQDFVEFCIKVYGEWTKTVSKIQINDSLYLSEPQGNFVWKNGIKHAVFLVGGIGISPFMSMLRFIQHEKINTRITLLYGNRTPETTVYKKELEGLFAAHRNWNLQYIFSHIEDTHPWTGYRGFITSNMIEKEVDFKNDPIFFMAGPPVFIEKMNKALKVVSVSDKNIRQELHTTLQIETQ